MPLLLLLLVWCLVDDYNVLVFIVVVVVVVAANDSSTYCSFLVSDSFWFHYGHSTSGRVNRRTESGDHQISTSGTEQLYKPCIM